VAVYKPKRKSEQSKFFVCEFIIHGKRIQESTGATNKTLAREYEKRRRAELERAAVGLPSERNCDRIRVSIRGDRILSSGLRTNPPPD
jgi:hypothetical protein